MELEDLSYHSSDEQDDNNNRANRRMQGELISTHISYDFSMDKMKSHHEECPLFVGELVKKYYNEFK